VWAHSDEVWDVVLSDGTVVESTADHPWWDASTRAWTRTDHLSAGDRLATSSGGTVAIAMVRDTGRVAETFNLTVSGPHTYYVGGDTLLVHNCPLKSSADGSPKNNQAQNRQFSDAVQAAQRQLGRSLSKGEVRMLHDEISGQNYGFWVIVDSAVALFGGH